MHRKPRLLLDLYVRYCPAEIHEKEEKVCEAKEEEGGKKSFFRIPPRLLPCQSGPLKILNK